MNPHVRPAARLRMMRALTRLELLVVLGCLALLAGLALPALGGRTLPRSQRVVCVNNLRQIGLAMQMWAGDNGDAYVDHVPVSRGGTLGRALTYEHFRALSNEFQQVQLLVCPGDITRSPATNFQTLLRNESVSYFIGTDALPALANTFLGGDRHIEGAFTPGSCGVAGNIQVTRFPPVSWSGMRWARTNHLGSGNILEGDGRVEQVSSSELGRLSSLTLDNGQDNHVLKPLLGGEFP